MIAMAFASVHAFAGAGQTSAGVTTTIPDTTSASQNVNSQSSNFVQENQAVNSGTSAGTVSGTTTATNGKSSTTGSTATDANGKPIDPNNPNAPKTDAQGNPIPPKPPAAPAAPPAPPPEYVSNMKKVNRTATDVAVVDAPVAGTAVKPDKITSGATPMAPVDTGAPTAPGAQRQTTATAPRTSRTMPDADKRVAGGNSTTPATTGSSGGSGTAPDSYAFYVGLLIAGVLLAFAAATFLRAERGGKP
jgi:hypothetical protein